MKRLVGQDALVSAVLTLLIAGCNAQHLPGDAAVQINPDNTTISVVAQRNADGLCQVRKSQYTDFPIVVRLTTSDGSPIGNVPVEVYVELTGHTFPQTPMLAVYQDSNNNGVIDGDAELVSDVDDPVIELISDQWTGTVTLLVRANLSCGYRARVHAIASGISGFGTIEVQEVEQTDNQLVNVDTQVLSVRESDDEQS